MLSMPELLIVGGLVVLMFGSNKLPKLGGAIGESIKNFKKGVRDDHDHPPQQQLTDDKKDDSKKEDEPIEAEFREVKGTQ